MAAKVYKSKRALKLIKRTLLWFFTILLVLLIAVFFIFKSWTVYDEEGAHIIFPWAEASDGIS